MATTIVTKSGSGAPTTNDLIAGELAVDLTNKRLYTENSSGTVLELGTNPASDVTFGDNTKAVFGDGSDLRIYHTGSHSTIENIGTGHLQIHTTDFRLRDSAGTESMILANADGNVQLYYDNALKLATTATGIDVTGTVTADGLTVSGAQNSKVAYFDDTSEGGYRQLQFTSSTNGQFWDINSQGTSGGLGGVLTLSTRSIDRLKIDTNGDLSLYEDTGTTPKFFWDSSAESLGINETAPFGKLHISDAQTGRTTAGSVGNLLVLEDDENGMSILSSDAGTGYILFGDTASASAGGISYEHSANKFNFRTNDAWNRMILDASGNLLVGKTTTAVNTLSQGPEILAKSGFASLTRPLVHEALNVDKDFRQTEI
jgi:hypothetical protein